MTSLNSRPDPVTITILHNPGITEEARADIADIWHATTASGTPLEEDPSASWEDSLNAAHQAIAAVEKGDLWVAMDDRTVIGTIFLVANRSRSERHWMQVKAMMVRPSRQRGGVGSLLLEAAHRYAQVELRLDRLLLNRTPRHRCRGVLRAPRLPRRRLASARDANSEWRPGHLVDDP